MIIKIANESSYNIRRDFGVYLLRCIPENRIYIGSTKQSFRARFSNHIKFLSKGTLGNAKLQLDYIKYGPDNFEFEILGIYPEILIVTYEQKFIDDLQPYYNILKASNNSKTNLNRKFSEEHKNKIRSASKKFKHSEESLALVTKLNKENASKYRITNIITSETFVKNFKEAEEFFNTSCFYKFNNRVYKNIWKIELLQKQAKSISLLVNNEWLSFSSYEKCDKFLNKWRGYTSTKMLKGCSEIDNYKVKIE